MTYRVHGYIKPASAIDRRTSWEHWVTTPTSVRRQTWRSIGSGFFHTGENFNLSDQCLLRNLPGFPSGVCSRFLGPRRSDPAVTPECLGLVRITQGPQCTPRSTDVCFLSDAVVRVVLVVRGPFIRIVLCSGRYFRIIQILNTFPRIYSEEKMVCTTILQGQTSISKLLSSMIEISGTVTNWYVWNFILFLGASGGYEGRPWSIVWNFTVWKPWTTDRWHPNRDWKLCCRRTCLLIADVSSFIWLSMLLWNCALYWNKTRRYLMITWVLSSYWVFRIWNSINARG